jgi:hypothetical protein
MDDDGLAVAKDIDFLCGVDKEFPELTPQLLSFLFLDLPVRGEGWLWRG